MSTIAYVVIAVVVVLAVIAAVLIVSRRRSDRLQGTFGPEYDRAVRQTGDRRQAERELAGRVQRRKQLMVVPLPEPARQQYIAAVAARTGCVRRCSRRERASGRRAGFPGHDRSRLPGRGVRAARRRCQRRSCTGCRQLPQRARSCCRQRPGSSGHRGASQCDDAVPRPLRRPARRWRFTDDHRSCAGRGVATCAARFAGRLDQRFATLTEFFHLLLRT